MTGSPAARGAVASLGGARRACFAAASAEGGVSAAIAASMAATGGPQRRIATVDCAVVNRFAIPCPGRNACTSLRRTVSESRLLHLPIAATIDTADSLLEAIGSPMAISHIRQPDVAKDLSC